MESKPTQKRDEFKPSNVHMQIMTSVFNMEETIIDPEFNSTHVCLTEQESILRAALVSDIEYTFSLALKKGDFYLGQAEISFYLERLPESDDELFLNSNTMAVSELSINEDPKLEQKYFTGQKIRLEIGDLKQGWNVISLKYFTPYQKNRTGLHQFID